ncbi:MAG: hypothetical protein ACLQJR_32110 [Stellaceae bacterium]
MEKRHPHADAVYRVVPRVGNTFGVEISIPDTHPTTVTSFASEADAETWIANHKRRAEEGPTLGSRPKGRKKG